MKRILICEDDSGIYEVVKIILENNNYLTSTANDLDSLNKELKKSLPDLILLDVWLGNVDGRLIVKKLKKDIKTQKIPVIIISALNDTEAIANNVGADDYISKPFEMNDLIRKVNKYL